MIARLRLVAFDLRHGLPTAAAVLWHELTPVETGRVLLGILRRSLVQDPYAALVPRRPRDEAEVLSRHQLKPLLLLDRALREDLRMPDERALAIMGEVVARTGARFIQTHIRFPDRRGWESMSEGARTGFLESMMGRFFNATAELLPPGQEGAELGFDVSACHFVDLTRRLGRPELAPLFCAADSVFFGSERSPVELERAETLASGGSRCAFRFQWKASHAGGGEASRSPEPGHSREP